MAATGVSERNESTVIQNAESVLQFWFENLPIERASKEHLEGSSFDSTSRRWFRKNLQFDAEVREKFSRLLDTVSADSIDHKQNKLSIDGTTWLATPRNCLAYILLTDQFSRNIYRGTDQAFAWDDLAKTAAQLALQKKFDLHFMGYARGFFYTPFEHSEKLEDQVLAVELFTEMSHQPTALPAAKRFEDSMLDYALQHYRIIERFGRFPHRNVQLGRTSTADELSFLKEPGSGF